MPCQCGGLVVSVLPSLIIRQYKFESWWKSTNFYFVKIVLKNTQMKNKFRKQVWKKFWTIVLKTQIESLFVLKQNIILKRDDIIYIYILLAHMLVHFCPINKLRTIPHAISMYCPTVQPQTSLNTRSSSLQVSTHDLS